MTRSLFGFAKNFFNIKHKNHSKTSKASRWARPSLMQLEDRLVMDTGLAGNSFPFDNTQPNLALNYLVALNGLFPSPGNSFPSSDGYGSPVLGEVTLFAGNYAPSGYALAQGQLLSIYQNTALFSILGTNFGGDGVNTFALPDLRGATAIGAGQGSGLSQRDVGDLAGMPTTTLLYDDLPSHDHELLNPATIPPTVTGTTGTVGSSLPLNNLMPTVAFNYQVVTTGNYSGAIALFCGPFMANKAQGQLLPISENNTLFSKLGTTFGGDGANTFALPDMQGRVAVGAGSGLGLSTYTLGQTGGTETITLTTNNLATHSHLQLDTNTPTSETGGNQPFNNIQPFNTLTYAICTSGLYPASYGQYGGEPFLGQIKMFASNTLPSGWIPCDGRILSINNNQALYSVVGNFYGGNGITSFALPDLRGRVPVGAGLPLGGGTYILGQISGVENNVMTANTLATHAHTTPPVVSITATTSIAYESTSPVALPTRHTQRTLPAQSATSQLVYTIARDNIQGAGTVSLDFSGNSSLEDYFLSVSSGATFSVVGENTVEITFPANDLEVTLTASVLRDRLGESREFLTFTLVDGADYNLHFSLQSATGAILDAAPLVVGGGGNAGSSSNGAQVQIFNQGSSDSGDLFTPFPGFQGEVRVTQADANGDGIPEAIVSAGPGGGPAVQIRDGATGSVLANFFAYDSTFTGGVYVAAQDMNNDGFADIVTSAGAGGGSHIKVFDGRFRRESASFFAYDPSFTGGTSIACFDTDGDGNAEIVVGAGPGGGPHVKVFSGSNFALVKEFMAYDPSFRGGVFVAIGDVGVDGRVDIITGAGPGGSPHVKVWDYENLTAIQQFGAFPTAVNDQITDSITQVNFRGGVRVGIADYDGDGINDVIAAAGPGGGPRVQVYGGLDFDIVADFFTTDPSDRSGVFVS